MTRTEPPVNRGRLFLAGCVAMVTLAVTFAVRADILASLGREFGISHARQGLLATAISAGYLVAILAGGHLADILGMGRLLGIACAGHLAGITLTILSPAFGFPALLAATLVVGVADGVAEAVMNPLAATLYPHDRTGRISILHAGWPAGLILGGLLCLAITPWFSEAAGWRVKMATALLPAAAYGFLIRGQRFPRTALAGSGGAVGSRWREAVRPGFLLLMVAMVFCAATEVGPDQWIGSVMTETVGVRGIAFLMYTSVIMFVMRLNGGALSRWLTPFGLLSGSCLAAGAGLLALSRAVTPGTALVGATLFGIGKTCLWTTLLGVTADRYPRGGSFLPAVVSAVGMSAAGAIGPVMGAVYDRWGAAMTFRFASGLPLVPLVIFIGFGLWHRSRGGYRRLAPGGRGD